MPLTLVPPRKGLSPNWRIRGTHVRVATDERISVDRTTGTPSRAKAEQALSKLITDIESGEYQRRLLGAAADDGEEQEPTFAQAALAYVRAGGADSFLDKITAWDGEHSINHKLVSKVTQTAIDNLAATLYPDATPQTRNRQVYTPVSAVLKRAGVERQVKRPKGWRGNKAQSWLEPEDAEKLVDAAYDQDPEFGLLCLTLLYTGMRLGEAINARLRDLRLGRALLYLPDTKTDTPRGVHLPPVLVEAFRSQPVRRIRPRKAEGIQLVNGQAGRSAKDAGVPFLKRSGDEKLFRYHIGGALRDLLKEAMKAAGLSFPRRQGGFHLFCHTYGTWMHHYGGLDTFGLVRTKRWKSPESADRYSHTVASPEAKRADLLPVPTSRQPRVKSVQNSPRSKKPQLKQRLRYSFTRERSKVRSLVRPPSKPLFDRVFHFPRKRIRQVRAEHNEAAHLDPCGKSVKFVHCPFAHTLRS